MTLRHEKRFNEQGYSLDKFTTSDTRRINPMGGISKYYASKDGILIKGFEDAVEAGEWIEGKEITTDNVTTDPIYNMQRAK